MFIYRINFSYLHTGIVISCSWYNPYFFISVPNDTVRCNNSTSTPKEMSISDMQMKQPTNISRLMQLCLPLLLCALGNVSNMKGKRRSKLPLEERGDAKLLHLSPRRHPHNSQGGRGPALRERRRMRKRGARSPTGLGEPTTRSFAPSFSSHTAYNPRGDASFLFLPMAYDPQRAPSPSLPWSAQ
jgi:hypothetical protein